MTTRTPRSYLRGEVYGYKFDPDADPKPALIVSNNAKNRSRFPIVHVLRITTAPKGKLDTIVPIPSSETIKGSVICDDLALVLKDDLQDRCGALSPRTMALVDDALRVVLSL